ncbi:MAG: transporter ATP-binding protein [Glaciihabitans sp.]|jgi:putative ABC transport system ATP-binding protein|nr:transporter ATP-binding protein [Glaciihabitans sp.]MDQ1555097.1 putative transport system ATP-binding protein [Actinomycetota bacterium]
MPLLALDGVTRSVELPDGPPLEILRGVNLEVFVGDHVSIIGRSGSGKSTLLNILGLLDSPSMGSVTFDGRATAKLSSRERDTARGGDIGFIFQQFNLLDGRTALENVITPLLYASGRQFWKRREIGLAMLDRVGLTSRANSLPSTLSGGEQQRVAIARALVRGPRLILADEPTGALDLETGSSVMALLDDVTESSGAALITITHDANVAALARRHYRLDRGVLTPIDVGRVLAMAMPEVTL